MTRPVASALIAALAAAIAQSAHAADARVARGRYLVAFGGCGDCHTPGAFTGKPDLAKALSGSDTGFAVPGAGVFVGPNLTSDKETGLGKWTTRQIEIALTTGVRPDGRTLAPIMPWQSIASLNKTDVTAIALYLQSLPPIVHKVDGPFGPNETPTVAVMTRVSPAMYACIPGPDGRAPAGDACHK